ncbi:MAG: discoidin domain-containing protein, partial [Clostridia bacterium]|nr:discoidin domain-containing protein [Clostridia bacterium]
MKKVFLVIIAAALMLSLCMINSFAASSVKHVSRDQVVIEEDNKDVAKIGGNSDPTDVDVAEYTGKTLRIWGWLGTVSPIAGFGYTINGGEIVTGDFAVAAGQDVINAAAGAGATEASRFKVLVPITEGGYTIDVYCIMESGNEKIWTVNVNGGDPNNVTYKWADAASESNIGLWMRNLGEKAVAKFTTKYAFDAVRLPIYWASTMANQGATPNFSISVYANAGNADLSLEAAPLRTKVIEATGDNNPAALFEFDTPLDAGTYYFVVETVGTNGKEFDGTNNSAYLVLPTASSSQGVSYTILASGKHRSDPLNFSIRAAQSSPFDTVPAEVTQDVTNIDFALLFNGAGFVENLGKGPNLGQLTKPVAAGANSLYIIGWYLPPATIATMSYQVDNGELMPINVAFVQDTADAITSWGYNGNLYRGFDALVPLQEGAHTVKLVATLVSGRTVVFYQTSYKNDESDIALDKPVFIDLQSGLRNAAGYWADEYVNDGYNPVHNPNVVADPVPLGFYPVENPVGTPIRAKIYIDLQGVYDLTEIDLHPQGFNNQTFPSAYDLYTSVDSVNWELVASVTGRTGNVDSADPFVYATTNRAQYILLDIKGGNDAYASIGEIEAYGTFVEAGSDVKPAYIPYKSYEGEANTADPGGSSSWTGFSTGALTHKFAFNTDVSFYKIGFPAFWGFGGTPVTLEIIKDGATVVTKDLTLGGDGGITVDLGTTLAAGEYICKMTINDNSVNAETGNYNCYFVIGYANTGMLGKDYIACERGQIAFDIYSDDQGEGFIKRIYKEGMSRDQVRVEGVDKAKVGGNAAVTDIAENLYDSIGKNINFWGWYGNNMGLDKFGVKVDGGEMVYFDRYSDPSIAAHLTNNVFKGDFAYSDRFNIDVEITEGEHTAEVYAITDSGEVLVWTINYKATEAHEPVTRSFDSATDNQYFDAIFINDEDGPRANGNDAVAALKALIDGSAEEINKIGLYGWFASDSPIVQFGYILDDAEPVFDDSFVAPFGSPEEEATITGTRAGGKRYRVNVDVSGLKDGAT